MLIVEKTFEFEIHFITPEGDLKETTTGMGGADVVEAVYKLINRYKEDFNIDLMSENFVYLREYDGNI